MSLTDSPDLAVVLSHTVDGLLSEVSSVLDPQVALVRAARLLAEVERLSAVVAVAVADVDARELWALPGGPGSGGTRTWLRSLPGGDSGQLALGRRLNAYAWVRGAVLVGQTGVRGALAVIDLPRVFRTAVIDLVYAATCSSVHSLRTSFGVL